MPDIYKHLNQNLDNKVFGAVRSNTNPGQTVYQQSKAWSVYATASMRLIMR